jgi:TATA-binding protein-associated factor Taf7
LLENKIDRLLNQKAQAEAVSQALPKDRQTDILRKQLESMSGANG